jgi:hypothetical protein
MDVERIHRNRLELRRQVQLVRAILEEAAEEKSKRLLRK